MLPGGGEGDVPSQVVEGGKYLHLMMVYWQGESRIEYILSSKIKCI